LVSTSTNSPPCDRRDRATARSLRPSLKASKSCSASTGLDYSKGLASVPRFSRMLEIDRLEARGLFSTRRSPVARQHRAIATEAS